VCPSDSRIDAVLLSCSNEMGTLWRLGSPVFIGLAELSVSGLGQEGDTEPDGGADRGKR
jgi:hypothetical protein